MNVMHGYILISDSMLIANLFTSDELHGNDHTPTHTVACCKLNHNILQPIIIMLLCESCDETLHYTLYWNCRCITTLGII